MIIGVAPNILTKRLESFIKDEIMTASKGEFEYFEYHLTENGRDFARVLISLREWGDRWAAPKGPPVVVRHKSCGGRVLQKICCDKRGKKIQPSALVAEPTAAYARYLEGDESI